MTDSLIVIADDTVAGSLDLLPGGRLQFSYDEKCTARSDATPLSLSMPLTRLTHPDSVITPWLWGLVPDDPSVLVRWERHFHLTRAVPFTLLGTPIGLDCPGAVRFARPDQSASAVHGEGRVTWLTEDDVAQVLRELERDSTSWLGVGFTGQFSLAGAQAKTALLYQDGRWGIPSGATPTTHILKPAIAGLTRPPSWWTATTGIRQGLVSAAFTKRTCVRRWRYRRPGNTRMKAGRAPAISLICSAEPCRPKRPSGRSNFTELSPALSAGAAPS
jgi:HipA-like protein